MILLEVYCGDYCNYLKVVLYGCEIDPLNPYLLLACFFDGQKDADKLLNMGPYDTFYKKIKYIGTFSKLRGSRYEQICNS